LSADLTLTVLKAISNPIRKSIIQSLSDGTLGFSEIMRASRLNPNYDTGPFVYHLSSLIDLNIIEKCDGGYELTEFGGKIAEFISTVERESSFLLGSPRSNLGGEKGKMKEIESKWLTDEEFLTGEYGIILGGPYPKSERDIPELSKWMESLPTVKFFEAPGFKTYVLGFEKDGKKLGCMRVRFTIGAISARFAKSEEDKKKTRGLAFIQLVWVVGKILKEVGEARASAMKKMMVEFEEIAKEHNIETIVFEDLLADDKEAVDILKGLGYERVFTRYYMRKTGIV